MSAQPHLIFIADKHQYYLDGQPVPSVTQVLEVLVDYSKVPPAVLEHARQIGSAVHRACQLHDDDDLVADSLDPRLLPYLAAWVNFKRDTGFVVELNEHRVWSWTYRVAGCLDRVGVFQGLLGKPRAVVEIKTTADFMPAFGPQVAAYEKLAVECGVLSARAAANIRRYVVQLREDGTYRLERYESPVDFGVFLSCLNIQYFLSTQK